MSLQQPTHHLPHLLMLLHAVERARKTPAGVPDDLETTPNLYLLGSGEASFWELLGLRLEGFPSLLVGGVRFRRQAKDRDDLSRQSLVSYLSNPNREMGVSETPRPAHLMEVILPDTRQPILRFIERCRAGHRPPHMLVDISKIRFAFDFRLQNPSRMRQAGELTAAERYLFRTSSGHLLSAVPHRLPTKLHREDPFLALTRPVQHTSTEDRVLPTLVVHRNFVTMTAPVGGKLAPWLQNTMAFHAELAEQGHILDPELEAYRTYRERRLDGWEEGERHAPAPGADGERSRDAETNGAGKGDERRTA